MNNEIAAAWNIFAGNHQCGQQATAAQRAADHAQQSAVANAVAHSSVGIGGPGREWNPMLANAMAESREQQIANRNTRNLAAWRERWEHRLAVLCDQDNAAATGRVKA